jgi:hypothetical protein
VGDGIEQKTRKGILEELELIEINGISNLITLGLHYHDNFDKHLIGLTPELEFIITNSLMEKVANI